MLKRTALECRGLTVSSEKTRITVGFSSRTAMALDREAKRLGITFSDQVRRITDAWTDQLELANKPRERIVVLDKSTRELIPAR